MGDWFLAAGTAGRAPAARAGKAGALPRRGDWLRWMGEGELQRLIRLLEAPDHLLYAEARELPSYVRCRALAVGLVGLHQWYGM